MNAREIADELNEIGNGLRLVKGRLRHVREICEEAIEWDRPAETSSTHWTNRHWLAQCILNILDGKIDDQIKREISGDKV